MTYNFTDKTVILTGASRGIGATIAKTLAEGGARVILISRNAEPLSKLAAQLPHHPDYICADLMQEDCVTALAGEISEKADSIDILVNNAGIVAQEDVACLSAKAIDALLNVNVRNLMLLTGALSENLKVTRGAVVNVSSIAAQGGMVGQAAYATSKGAVNAFTRNAAIDLGRFGVRVNAVAPGPVDGGMWDAAFEAGLDRQTVMDSMKHLIPLEGRWSSEQDIADAVAWLASDKAAMVTGQIIGVDGGMLA